MDDNARTTLQSTFEASNEGRLHFAELIGRLAGVHVQSYQVDFRTGRTTYFMPDDETLNLISARSTVAVADAFDGSAVRTAILGAQQGRVLYPEFKRLTQAAGCIGYTVWIAGRHVTYYGRRGETHVERFPD